MSSQTQMKVQSEQVVRRATIVPNYCDPIHDADYELVQVRRQQTTPCSTVCALPPLSTAKQAVAESSLRNDASGEEVKDKPAVRSLVFRRRNVKPVKGSKALQGLSIPMLDAQSMRSLKGILDPSHVYKLRLNYSTNPTSSAAGIIALSYGMDPSSSSEWASCAGLFDEFRVLTSSLRFCPNNRYSKIATQTAPIAAGFDNDSAAVPSSYDMPLATQFGYLHTIDDPFWIVAHRPNVTPSAYWVDCAVPSGSLGAITLYSNGLTVSTAYGVATRYYDVEFRMRQ